MPAFGFPSTRVVLVLSAVLAHGVAPSAHGQVVNQGIEDISVDQNADGTTARFRFATPLSRMPTLFTMDSPPRLVIDFKGIGEARRRTLPFDASLITAATLVGASDRTRVVLALREPARGQFRMEGNDLLLTLKPAADMPATVRNGQGRRSGAGKNAGPDTEVRETLLVELTVNDQPMSGIVRAERLADGRLALPLDAWRMAGLRPLGDTLGLPDGERGYALEAVANLEYRIDRARLVLALIVPAAAFDAASYSLGGAQRPRINAATAGLYVNYSLAATRQQTGGGSFGGLIETVIFSGAGSLVAGAAVRGDGQGPRVVRTDTYWRRDWPAEMKSLVLGDTVGGDGGWSRPARFGGIRYGRDFALSPGFISYPLPSVSGSAALPSTIDVLVNNQRQSSANVKAGAFDLTNVPVVSGAGEINLVVRDLRGVETVLAQGYYMSPLLLAAGLSDFSFEAGALRSNYGSAADRYGPRFAAGVYRYGLTPGLTVSGRAELQGTRQATGMEATGLLDTIAVARGAFALSHSDADGAQGRNGTRWLAALERVSHNGGGVLQWEHFSDGFVQFGAVAGELRPKARLQANLGIALGAGKSAGMSYIRQTNWAGERFTLAGANLGFTLARNVHLSAYVSQQIDSGTGWSGGLNLIVPTGNQNTVVATSNRDRHGKLVDSIQLGHMAPPGEGWGWNVRASDLASQRALAGVTLNTDVGRFTADASLGADVNAARIGADGSAGWFEGLPFATRRIDQGAFAVVRVGDLAGVPVMRSNQVVAVTNRRGLALVPGLLPYQTNFLTVDPDQLPFDVTIGSVQRVTVPYARSGVLLDFPIHRTRNVMVTLVQSNGTPVPPGARVTVLPGRQEFVVVRRGGVYLADIQGVADKMMVRWNGGSCTVALALGPTLAGETHIGPLACGSDNDRTL